MEKSNSDTNIATMRTTTNMSLLTVIVLILNKVFDWDITLDELLVFTPVIVPAILVFYRLSLYLTKKFPPVGYVLFGYKEAPTYE